MKGIGKKSIIAALLGCCLIWANPSEAKVCFAGDGDCGGIDSFGGYTDPTDAIKKQCSEAGYTTTKTDCLKDGMQVTEFCPYDANYVICCSYEYMYDACVYPLKNDGRCGSKYKCKCDDKYKYQQANATTCRNVSDNTIYNNSRADGASCVYQSGPKSINTFFTQCSCDRGLYPKTQEECASNGASVSTKSCTDSNGSVFYSSCICSSDFTKIASDCAYGININEPMCQQGDVIKVRQCCDCNAATYPYTELSEVESSSSPVKSYASCEKERGCTRGSRYRATECKTGYKVYNGKCVPKECYELLPEYLSSKGITSYQVYNSTKPTATNVIIAKDSPFQWSHFANKKVLSAAAYARSIYGSDTLTTLIKTQCTNIPTITATDTNLTATTNITSIAIRSNTLNNKSTFTCINCSLDIGYLYSTSPISLQYNASLPNERNVYADYDGGEVKAEYKATGYHHNFGNKGFKVINPKEFVFMISGANNSSRVNLTGDMFTVNGLAAFQYAEIRINAICIGTTCKSTLVSAGTYPPVDGRKHISRADTQKYSSTLSLYNSNYWLYENNGTVRNLHMASSSLLGDEKGRNSNIHFYGATHQAVGFVVMWGDCSDRPDIYYPYISPSGTIDSRKMACHYYAGSVKKKEDRNKYDNNHCRINGKKERYPFTDTGGDAVADCAWDVNTATKFFRFDGKRGF